MPGGADKGCRGRPHAATLIATASDRRRHIDPLPGFRETRRSADSSASSHRAVGSHGGCPYPTEVLQRPGRQALADASSRVVPRSDEAPRCVRVEFASRWSVDPHKMCWPGLRFVNLATEAPTKVVFL